jgi:hypothetical protein
LCVVGPEVPDISEDLSSGSSSPRQFNPEDEGTTILQNIGNYLPKETA